MEKLKKLDFPAKAFTVPLWVIIFLQTFTIVQMGVIYYSSKAFTVNGVNPLPVSVETTVLPIVLGYIFGAALLIALAAVIVHSVMLDLLRDNTALLYSFYAAFTLVLLVVYFLTEPYFRRVWLDSGAEDSSSAFPKVPREFKKDGVFGTLTNREKEVLMLAVQGYADRNIAQTLYISEHTVKSHIKSIYQKLDVHSRFELAAKVNREA